MNYNFVLGMGRSGTKFLSEFLSLNSEVYATHEFVGNREYWLMTWYLGSSYSKTFLLRERERINKEVNADVFIDVNSYLADSYNELNEVFDTPNIFHLVRNPKKVVPSIMTRRHEGSIQKLPKTQDKIEEWLIMSDLEKVCYNWVQVTEDLLSKNAILLQFEKLVTDYNYVKKNLLEPIGISISENEYSTFKSKKVNKTKSVLYRYLYAKYKGKNFVKSNYSFENFTAKEKESFYRICGATMEKLGYK